MIKMIISNTHTVYIAHTLFMTCNLCKSNSAAEAIYTSWWGFFSFFFFLKPYCELWPQRMSLMIRF